MTDCPNKHGQEHIKTRPNGARVCGKCADHYRALHRVRATNPRKVTPTNERRNH
jgi:hypothetical protein